MNLNSESKFFLSVGLITTAIIVIGLFIFSKPQDQNSTDGPTFSKEQLITDTTATIGNKDAQHYLVEFSDFQCPACKAYEPTVNAIISKYKDQLLFAYRHFPLDQHPFALPAAQTAIAAQKQNKFWEAHNLLFERQEQFNEDFFADLYKPLEIDQQQYKKDFEQAKDLIAKDRADGISLGVNSTPTFYLNGKKLNLQGPADLQSTIDSLFLN